MKSSILLFLTIVSVTFAQNSTPTASPAVLKTENGRYVFGQIGPARADQFLLDTQTGRLWQVVVDKEGRQKLQPVPIIQILGDEAYIPETDGEVAAFRKMMRQRTLDELQKTNAAGPANDK
ncbi:hypothetical protein K0B96_11010 [Horticoccus luteus]|uniref:Uncharacterized protein n=1 Tax=Horticoccus luteus TaxID=2862869 RepID=A0A8F9TT70_9BACT|nr:hypothetical protein [Horticoccus luteus]QYM77848.1 hypothetical protein K0B96_11010 [Horticoccus luteus]